MTKITKQGAVAASTDNNRLSIFPRINYLITTPLITITVTQLMSHIKNRFNAITVKKIKRIMSVTSRRRIIHAAQRVQIKLRNIEKILLNADMHKKNTMQMACVKIVITQKEEQRWHLSVITIKEGYMQRVFAKTVT